MDSELILDEICPCAAAPVNEVCNLLALFTLSRAESLFEKDVQSQEASKWKMNRSVHEY